MFLEKVLHIAKRCVVLFPQYTTPTKFIYIHIHMILVGVVYSCFNEGKFGKIAPPLVLHIALRCVVLVFITSCVENYYTYLGGGLFLF